MIKYILILFTAGMIVSCGKKSSDKVLPLDVYKHQMSNENTFQLIDVRTPGEFVDGTIPGAINIDYKSSDFEDKIKELDSSIPTYIFCRSGNRSGKAFPIFERNGFLKLYDLEGGYLAYKKNE